MRRGQQLRPGEKVSRSGIYQERLSKRRATLVKGEPAPPTPHKAGQWQQVVDTASTTAQFVRTWSAFWGFCVGVFLTRWGGAATAPRSNSTMRRHNTTRRLVRGPRLRRGHVIAFSAGVLLGMLVPPSLGPPRHPATREDSLHTGTTLEAQV
jgi:hypothetical protein